MKVQKPSERVKTINNSFVKQGCKIKEDGSIRYFEPISIDDATKVKTTEFICHWSCIVKEFESDKSDSKLERCIDVNVNIKGESTIRFYTNIYRLNIFSKEKDLEYTWTGMGYCPVSGNTLKMVSELVDALIEEVKELIKKETIGIKVETENKSENKVVIQTATVKTSKSKPASTKSKKSKNKIKESV